MNESARKVVDTELKLYVTKLLYKWLELLKVKPNKMPFLKMLLKMFQIIHGPEQPNAGYTFRHLVASDQELQRNQTIIDVIDVLEQVLAGPLCWGE